MNGRHLAILTYDFPPESGGVQTYLFEVARRLATRHQVTIVTTARGPLDEPDLFRRDPGSRRFWAFQRAVRSLGASRLLVGHVHPQLLLAARLSRPHRYAVIAHGNDFLAAAARWHRPLTWALLRHARPLVANSKATAEQLARNGLRPQSIIYPGTDPHRFTPAAEAVDVQRWLTVGRLVPRKNIDHVLHALASLQAEWPSIHYDIVGEGPEMARLEALARGLRIEDRVTFHGRVGNAELPPMYRRSGLFVMPADTAREGQSVEGFGIVFLEAAASGLPVVAARSGGVLEAVDDGETGLLVPPGDREALVRSLRKLMRDPGMARQLGANGRRRVEATFNWDRATAEWERILFLPGK